MSLTPCGTAYQCFGDFLGTKRYEDIDERIISRTFLDAKGRSPYDRIQTTKTYRTREIIQKDPRALDPRTFAGLFEAARDLVAYFKHEGKNNAQICNYFVGEGARTMTQSLTDSGYDARVFQNTMEDLARNNNAKQLDTVMAILMLFCSMAFYADPKIALNQYLKAAKRNGIAVTMQTGLIAENEQAPAEEAYALLGLVRRFDDGRVGEQVYRLNPGADGTLIGRMATEDFSISDVDPSVSRKHLLVYREGNTWMAQGQGSTNGSVLERAGGARSVIERGKGSARRAPIEPPISIQAGDRLLLGLGTTFEVVLLGYANE